MSDSSNLPVFKSPLEGAAQALKEGYYILPLRPLSKIPAVENWPAWSKKFTLERLLELPADYDGNFGIHPGPSGHCVVDIDCGTKNGKQGKGLESLQKLIEKYGPLPKTRTVQTPSGGLHLYFIGKTANTTGTIGVNIDTKCENGMVVCPGSITPEGTYRTVDNRPPVELPQWLSEVAQPKQQLVLDRPEPETLDTPEHAAEVIRYLSEAPVCIEGQNGDLQLFRIFCQCRDLGASKAAAVELVQTHYNPRCQPPWNLDNDHDREHFHQKADNSYTYAQNSVGAKTIEAVTASAIFDFKDEPLPPDTRKIRAVPLMLVSAATMLNRATPTRDWIIKNVLLRSFLTITGAPGGTGKSNYEILKALAVVTGRQLLVERNRVIMCGPVVLYNCEDPLEEMERRVKACCAHFKIERSKVSELFLVSGRDESLCMASVNKNGDLVINEQAVETLNATVKSVGAILLSVDPLIRTHSLNENDNVAMDKVTQAFQRVSTETGCAVSLVHHTNKAALNTKKNDDSASQSLFRGAGSLVASARIAEVLTTMSETEATKLGIPTEKRRYYFKVENAKANLSAPAEFAHWYENKGQKIDNGEEIGVCVPAVIVTRAKAEEAGINAFERENVLAYLRQVVPEEGIEVEAIKVGLRKAAGIKPTRTDAVISHVRHLIAGLNEFVFTQPGGKRKPYRVQKVGATAS